MHKIIPENKLIKPNYKIKLLAARQYKALNNSSEFKHKKNNGNGG